MTEAEVNEVRDAILSEWITTGPRTKKLKQIISEYVHTEKTVCLNSATATMEMALHVFGVGSDEEAEKASTYHSVISTVKLNGCSVWEHPGSFLEKYRHYKY